MKLFAFAIAITLLGTTGEASSQKYRCEFNPTSRDNGWIPEWVELDLDQANGRATALDPNIQRYEKAPIPVTVKSMRNGDIKLSWALANMETRGVETIRVGYSLRMKPEKMTAQIAANIQSGGTQRPSSKGLCKKL